jgi:hypothetical protein
MFFLVSNPLDITEKLNLEYKNLNLAEATMRNELGRSEEDWKR